MNSAYKHLETRLRIAELTLGQWLGVAGGVGIAVLWGLYISPFGAMLTLFSAVYIGGIPALVSWLASEAEFDLWLRARSMWRWRKGADRYVPGPGPEPHGYILTQPRADPAQTPNGIVADLDLAALWD
jgi:hypothetical protein